ncbi:MAG: metallophosphoesterase, partial [Methylobacter sp.]|uniref:metallophosphoesterase n=1 Tax=Methylobacter sp. TaxID=2051955 RepID=UPI0025855307
MRIVCISDLHSSKQSFSVPDGNVLIIAGDICGYGCLDELEDFDNFLSNLPHKHKLLIAGNHDWPFTRVCQWPIILSQFRPLKLSHF